MHPDELHYQRPHPPLERFIPNPKLKFMEQCREVMRFRHLALRSEQAYLAWIKRFIFFHDKRHPRELSAAEVSAFLSHLPSITSSRTHRACRSQFHGVDRCPVRH